MKRSNKILGDTVRMLDKPNNRKAEEAIISCMLVDNSTIDIAINKITYKDFYYPELGVIFGAIISIYQAHKCVDPQILLDRLEAVDNLHPNFKSPEYISQLLDNVAQLIHFEMYVDEIKKKALLRGFIDELNIIQGICYREDKDLNEVIEDIYQRLFKLIEIEKNNNKIKNIEELTFECIKNIQNIKKNGVKPGVLTGFKELDGILNGFQKSDLILLASRPTMGKTTLAINIMNYIGLIEKKTVVFFSLEMSAQQIIQRILSFNNNIELQRIRTGNLTDQELDKLKNTSKILKDSKIFIDDTENLNISKIRYTCRTLKAQYKDLSLIVIDYLQLILTDDDKKSENRNQEISKITRSLKQLAKELDIPILLLSQLSRLPDLRTIHRPMLSDLRDSGAIEQDSDIVMFIYRDSVYDKNSEFDEAEIIIGKHRNGAIGTVYLNWEGKYVKFKNK